MELFPCIKPANLGKTSPYLSGFVWLRMFAQPPGGAKEHGDDTSISAEHPNLGAYCCKVLEVICTPEIQHTRVSKEVSNYLVSKLVYNLLRGLTTYLYRGYNPLTKYHGHPSRYQKMAII